SSQRHVHCSDKKSTLTSADCCCSSEAGNFLCPSSGHTTEGRAMVKTRRAFVLSGLTSAAALAASSDLVPIARVSNTILPVAVKAGSPYATMKDFTEAARKVPGQLNCAMVQGITEFTFWGYEAAEGLKITQVPYRDITASAVDLGEGRVDIIMLSYAMMQSQLQAGRIRALV